MKINRDEEGLLDRGGRPTLTDLLDRMTFSPARGMIDLNGARMVLSRATLGADLQDELVRRYGEHEAMVLLLRLGYRNGREDAEFIRRAWPNLDVGDAFTAGTRLHMLTGTVRVETLHNDFDFRNDRFSGDFLWHGSVEATEYQRRHGRAHKPVCWAQNGYASGYASVFFRKLIVYKEVSCAAMGAKSCRVVGKTVDDWGKDDPFVRTFLDEVLYNHARSPRPVRRNDLTSAPDGGSVLGDMIVVPVRRTLERLAEAGLCALITGPEGTGCAQAAAWLHGQRFPSGQLHRLHANSADLPGFVQSLRASLAKPGAREQTLVIEAVEDLPPALQLALLEMVQAADAGADKFLLIGTSHRRPADLARLPCLRPHFLHTLCVLPVEMPPLNARTDDIALFGEIWLSQLARRMTGPEPHLTTEARDFIRLHDWPGNLPELQSTVLRAALLAERPEAITEADIRLALDAGPASGATTTPPGAPDLAPLWHATSVLLDAGMSLDQLVSQLEQHALKEARGNLSAAARRLGLSRAKLDYRVKARPDEATDIG